MSTRHRHRRVSASAVPNSSCRCELPRSRSTTVRRRQLATRGRRSRKALNSESGTMSATTVLRATAVADLGAPSTAESSPSTSPVSNTQRMTSRPVAAARATFTCPESSTSTSCASSPSWKSTAPRWRVRVRPCASRSPRSDGVSRSRNVGALTPGKVTATRGGPPRLPSLDLWAQRREEHDLADRRQPGEEHAEAVDPDAEPAGGRHAVLQRAEVVLVDRPGLLVAGRPQLCLSLEPRSLVDRVVQLAESIGELTSAHHALETLDQGGVVPVDARERRDLSRIVEHEHRVDQLGLDELLVQLHDHAPGAPGRVDRQPELRAHRPQLL